ncbi:MAG: phosphatase PAP2 family protein [Bacteroidota bacterium]|nr:phosphatase PAP2 family protein [Bacteroidota bacterium]
MSVNIFKIKNILFLLLFVCLTNTNVYSNNFEINHKNDDTLKLNSNYFKSYFYDTKYILTSAFRWKTKDWCKAGIVVGTTIGLYTQDQKIHNFVQKNRSKSVDALAKIVEPAGGYYPLAALSLTYLGATVFDNNKAKRIALLGIESYLLSGAFVYALKLSGHRHRPNTGDPFNRWDGPQLSTHNLSFPSGHSAAAFSVASVISEELKETKWVPYLAYSIASMTALSRVYDNYHWTSDIFLGSVIGFVTGKTIVKLHKNNSAKLTFFPTIGKDNFSFYLSYRF